MSKILKTIEESHLACYGHIVRMTINSKKQNSKFGIGRKKKKKET